MNYRYSNSCYLNSLLNQQRELFLGLFKNETELNCYFQNESNNNYESINWPFWFFTNCMTQSERENSLITSLVTFSQKTNLTNNNKLFFNQRETSTNKINLLNKQASNSSASYTTSGMGQPILPTRNLTSILNKGSSSFKEDSSSMTMLIWITSVFLFILPIVCFFIIWFYCYKRCKRMRRNNLRRRSMRNMSRLASRRGSTFTNRNLNRNSNESNSSSAYYITAALNNNVNNRSQTAATSTGGDTFSQLPDPETMPAATYPNVYFNFENKDSDEDDPPDYYEAISFKNLNLTNRNSANLNSKNSNSDTNSRKIINVISNDYRLPNLSAVNLNNDINNNNNNTQSNAANNLQRSSSSLQKSNSRVRQQQQQRLEQQEENYDCELVNDQILQTMV